MGKVCNGEIFRGDAALAAASAVYSLAPFEPPRFPLKFSNFVHQQLDKFLQFLLFILSQGSLVYSRIIISCFCLQILTQGTVRIIFLV